MSETMDLQARDLESIYNLQKMQSLLDAMARNINLIQKGAQGKVITVSNANLYQLAAQYYGDATKWTSIAQANGLNDPEVQPTIFINVNSLLKLVFTGYVISPQKIVLNVTTEAQGLVVYEYEVLSGQSMPGVVASISALIPGSGADLNVLTLPIYLSVTFKIERFIDLVIPQTAEDSGGILKS